MMKRNSFVEEKSDVDLFNCGHSCRKSRYENHSWKSTIIIFLSLCLGAWSPSPAQNQTSGKNFWPTFRYNRALTGHGEANADWISSGSDFFEITPGQTRSPIIAADGTIILTNRGHSTIYAFWANGENRWRAGHIDTRETLNATALMSGNGIVYIGSKQGKIYEVDLKSGSLRHPPLVVDDNPPAEINTINLLDDFSLVVTAVNPARIYTVRGNRISPPISFGSTPVTPSTPAIDTLNGLVVVAVGSYIHGFDARGDLAERERWSDAKITNFTWVVASTNSSKKLIWAGSNQPPAVAVFVHDRPSSGSADFFYPFADEPLMPALDSRDRLYVVDADGNLTALTGDRLEKINAVPQRPPNSGRFSSMPIVDANDRLWVTAHFNNGDSLFAFSTTTGDIIHRYRIEGETNQSPAIGPGGVIYVPADNGKVSFVGPKPRIPKSLSPRSQQQPIACKDSTIEIAVTLLDQLGEPLQGHFIDFSVESGDGTISDATVCTDEEGVARTRWTLGPSSGDQRVKAIGYAPVSSKLQPVIFTANIAEPRLPEIDDVVFSPPVNSGGMRDTTITLTNPGPCTLKIDSLAIFDDSEHRFCILQSGICQNIMRPLIELGANASITVDLRFRADFSDSGVQTATLRIYSSDPDIARSTIPLKGVVIGPPIIIVDPESLAFKTACLDSLRTLPLVIRNDGGDTLSIKEFILSDPAFTASHVPAPIPAGDSDTVSITFIPTEKKNYSDTLTIDSNASNNRMLKVPLSGEAITANISGAEEVMFKNTKLFCMQDFASYTITNDSACDLVLESIVVDGGDFGLLSSAARDTIAPGGTREIVLKFTPKDSGWREGALRIKGKHLAEKSIPLKGYGIPTPKIEVTREDIISFLKTCTSDTTSDVTTKIFNRGKADLVVNLSTSNSAVFVLPIKQFVVAPKDSKTVEVRFAPSFARSFTDTLQITHNDPCGQAIAFPLSGEGIAPTVGITLLMDFASTEIGQADTATWRITNTAQECDVLIKNAIIDGANANDFNVIEGNWRERIRPGDLRELKVEFRPNDGPLGWREATLRLHSNSGSDSIPLKGYANADTTPPGHITSLSVEPPGWSSLNGFKLILGLPDDPSGIAKVYYRIGSPPSLADCSADGIVNCETASCNTITITAPGLGKHNVYIWLEDGKGNSNCMSAKHTVIYDQTAIYFDDELPSITHTEIGPAELNKPIEVIATARDAVSGIAAFTLYYRLGGRPRFNDPTEGFEAQSFEEGKATIPGNFVTDRGVEYKLVAVDLAGNRTFHPNDSNSFHAIQVNLPEGHYWWRHSGGTNKENYHLLSFPMEQTEPSVAHVLDDDIFLHDKKDRPAKWSARLWDIDPQKADSLRPFIEFPEVGDFDAGHAMFLITKHDEFITSEAGITVSTSEPFKLPAHKGWNLIGIPFNFNIPVENLLLYNSGIYGNSVFTFSGKWVRVDTLKPWQGYLIKIAEGAPNSLSIQPSEAIVPNTQRLEIFENTPQPAWSIAIRAYCEQAHDLDNVIGIVAEADTAWDRFERLEMPSLGDFVALYFPQQWQNYPGPYTTDYRPSLHDGQSWKFEVISNVNDRPAKLCFENLATVPSEYKLMLIDESPGIVQDLRSDSLYWFRSSNQATPRRFRMLVGRPDYVNDELAQYATRPADFVLEQNFPNPFNAVTTIKFGVPKIATISLLIYNAKGELVKTLITDEEKAPGYYAKLWEGVDQNGRSVASGLYFCRLREGKNKIVATKKLVLIK